jgi:hypothetical protein
VADNNKYYKEANSFYFHCDISFLITDNKVSEKDDENIEVVQSPKLPEN